MKDPDGPYDCIQDAVKASLGEQPLTVRERELLIAERMQAQQALVGKWLQYGEYITVEIDTDAGTATVLPAK